MASTMGPNRADTPNLPSQDGVVWPPTQLWCLVLYWEKQSRECCISIDFTKVDGWEQCYFHPKLEVVLDIYVDDFKMSGLKRNGESLGIGRD